MKNSEGLDEYYDLIVLGTGVTESIISCAAAKVGKKVLQLDPHDFYGGNLSTHSLSSLLEIIKRQELLQQCVNHGNTTTINNSVNSSTNTLNNSVKTSTSSVVTLINDDNLNFYVSYCTDIDINSSKKLVSSKNVQIIHPSCIGYVMEKERALVTNTTETPSGCYEDNAANLLATNVAYPNDTTVNADNIHNTVDSTTDTSSITTINNTDNVATIHPSFQNYTKHNNLTLQRALDRNREFNIDITAKIIYSAGDFIDCLIKSGVAKYLEFRSLEGLFYLVEDISTPNVKLHDSSVKPDVLRLWKVPCSKGDVFNTTQLNAIEKRTFMRFLQFISEWGMAHAGKELYSLNEKELALGRSLHRPQNKVKSVDDTKGNLDEELMKNKDFTKLMEEYKLSPKLQAIVIYALCFVATKVAIGSGDATDCTKLSAYEALLLLYRHVDSLGKYSETAFLVPIYGSGEITQAFCRMSAVWGGTFILRRGVAEVIYNPQEFYIDTESSEEKPVHSDEVNTAVEMTSSNIKGTKINSDYIVRDTNGNEFKAAKFVSNVSFWPGAVHDNSKVLVQAILVCSTSTILPLARSIAIIPPQSKFHDSDANQYKSLDNSHAIYIIQNDYTTSTTPEGSVILNINTIVETQRQNEKSGGSWFDIAAKTKSVANELVGRLVKLLHGVSEEKFVELLRVVLIRPIYHNFNSSPLQHDSLFITGENELNFHMQDAMKLAKVGFATLFPDESFFRSGADEEDAMEDEATAEYEKEEADYLQSMLASATAKESSKKQENENSEDIIVSNTN